MNSIISFPDRGNQWGDNAWRGNMSGHVVREVIEQYNPKYFVDVCCGSDTSGDVCREMGVDYTGLDIMYGNNYLFDDVASQIQRPADIVFAHSAYFDMIDYVNERKKHGKDITDIDGDHSRCESVDEFIYKSQVMLMNMREAAKPRNGLYMALIGDYRKQGKFYSFQSDFIQAMPRDELRSVTIKAQHNTMSGNRSYNNFKHPRIEHEYLLIWERNERTIYQVAWDKAVELKKAASATWRSLIRVVMMKLGTASLKTIYAEVEKIAGHKLSSNQNWKAKVRQTLQMHFTNVERGIWTVA